MERGNHVQGHSEFEFGQVIDLKCVQVIVANAAPRHVASTSLIKSSVLCILTLFLLRNKYFSSLLVAFQLLTLLVIYIDK